jgi:hypothetical protein
MTSGAVGGEDLGLAGSFVIQSGAVVIDTPCLTAATPPSAPQYATRAIPEALPTEEINSVRRPSSDVDFEVSSFSSVTFAYADMALVESLAPSATSEVAATAQPTPEEQVGLIISADHRARFSVGRLLSRLHSFRARKPPPAAALKK